MARFSAMVIQQSQERFKKLALIADEVMQCGTSLAEDLIVSSSFSSLGARPSGSGTQTIVFQNMAYCGLGIYLILYYDEATPQRKNC